MPITPFHFGPGIAAHVVAPQQVSFLAFCTANILMDFEPLYFLITHQLPLHRFFHTLVGASIIWMATLALFGGLRQLADVAHLPIPFHWQQLRLRPVAIGAALGSYSHIVLDGVMHSDLHPFLPFNAINPLLGVVSFQTLHWFCVAAGVVGLVILGARKFI